MGKQYTKIEKRRRRAAYLSRRKEKAKQPVATKSAVTKKSVKPAEPVAEASQDAAPVAAAPKKTRKPKAAKEAPAKEAAAE
jgi:hypothetical protein